MALTPDQEALLGAAEEIIKTTDTPGFKIIMAQIRKTILEQESDIFEVDPFDGKRVAEIQYRRKSLIWLTDTIEELIRSAVQPETIEEEAENFDDG